MLKLIALGALGYAGYRYYEKSRSGSSSAANRHNASARPQLAGGPLSENASLRHSADAPA